MGEGREGGEAGLQVWVAGSMHGGVRQLAACLRACLARHLRACTLGMPGPLALCRAEKCCAVPATHGAVLEGLLAPSTWLCTAHLKIPTSCRLRCSTCKNRWFWRKACRTAAAPTSTSALPSQLCGGQKRSAWASWAVCCAPGAGGTACLAGAGCAILPPLPLPLPQPPISSPSASLCCA